MFSEDYRRTLTDTLVARARADEAITGVALTGSVSVGREDRWSDIDIAFGIGKTGELTAVIADWTRVMYSEHQAVDHLDVYRKNTVYRVFLLSNSLQVDLAFSPTSEFGAVAPTFRLVSGAADEQPQAPGPDADTVIGMAWLYALHARSSIARDKLLQAEFMVSGMRNEFLSLACLRYGLPASQGRGLDSLPTGIADVELMLVGTLDHEVLLKAFRAVSEALINEIALHDESRALRLSPVLIDLISSIERS
jgi:hypothetical protein